MQDLIWVKDLHSGTLSARGLAHLEGPQNNFGSAVLFCCMWRIIFSCITESLHQVRCENSELKSGV